MADANYERFRAEIERLHKRLEWISEEEARSAMVGGVAAEGRAASVVSGVPTSGVIPSGARMMEQGRPWMCGRRVRMM